MTQQEILDYNKRCAAFLGGVYDSDMTRYWFHLPIKWDGLFAPTTEELKFHSDWNWIMEVVEAILEKCSNSDDMEAYYNILDTFPRKEAVVQAINKFLIWYNETSNQK